MLLEFLIYDLKVAALIAVFYMFHRLLLAKETFHRVNRIVLLATAMASFILPLCVITVHQTVTTPMPNVAIGDLQIVSAEEPASSAPWWQVALPILYIIGVFVTFGHTLWSISKVWHLIHRSEQHPQTDGITLCVTGNDRVSPFSWMNYIVMNRSDYEANDAAILAHERGHIRLRHSWDVLLVDALTALQWFNPAMWMLRSDLRAIHEYEADGAVLSQGINARQYQYLLITKAGGIGGYSIANGINHSTLKNRIAMMIHKKSQSNRLLKLLALIPIVGITLALNARTVTDYVYDEPQKQVPVKKGVKKGTIKTGTQEVKVVEEKAKAEKAETKTSVETTDSQNDKNLFINVEEKPEFPGGINAMAEFLRTNMHYPEEAHKADIQGRVIVTFVIEKDGSVTEAKVVRSVHPLLDEEAVRVVSAMPNWQPGKQDGKPVRVKYTIPIMFNLPKSSTPSSTVDLKSAELQALANPLVIMDGTVIDHEKLKTIDPQTIERMEVLKDQPAIEKYGEKAKNGVIIITTKK